MRPLLGRDFQDAFALLDDVSGCCDLPQFVASRSDLCWQVNADLVESEFVLVLVARLPESHILLSQHVLGRMRG